MSDKRPINWEYGNAWEKYPIESGDIWNAGNNKIACGDLFNPNTLQNLLAGQKVDLFYFVRKPEDFVYKDIFDLASQKIGIHVHYIVSDSNTNIEKLIKDHVKDYSRAKYYISGPSAMVDSYKKILKLMKIDRNKIVTDYFPGY